MSEIPILDYHLDYWWVLEDGGVNFLSRSRACVASFVRG